MTIGKMHEYFVGLFVFKSLNKKLPDIFTQIFKPNINARNSMNLRTVYCKRKVSQFSLKIAGVKIWNNFSLNAKKIYFFLKKKLEKGTIVIFCQMCSVGMLCVSIVYNKIMMFYRIIFV